MPSKSAAQHRLMEAVAHDPAFAKKAGIPQKVGKDFAAADEGKSERLSKEHKAAMLSKAHRIVGQHRRHRS